MSTKYSIEIDGDGTPITATTDESARRAGIKAAKENQGKQVFVSFFRSSDGQHGYINRDGADFTGEAY